MARKVAVLATTSANAEPGGAERFNVGLRDALRAAGADADLLTIEIDESSFDGILAAYLAFYDLDLSRYDGVISTKAPSYVVRHRNHVCYLLHTMRVFYDMFEAEFGAGHPVLHEQRRRIHELDTAALSAPGLRRYAIGEEVRRRLLDFNGLDATVVHPATSLDGFRSGPFKHLFLPGRLHRWKRVMLVVEAMSHVRAPVRLLIAGAGEDEAAIKAAAANDPRIMFLGRISDDEMRDHYANALAVPFVPYREDFGLVAIEAFHSGKPVVTCTDAGEQARMTEAFGGGIVCDPTAVSIAAAIDRLHADGALARRLGEQGRAGAAEIRWDRVAGRMLAALGMPT